MLRCSVKRDNRINIVDWDKVVMMPAGVSLCGEFCEEAAAQFRIALASAETRALETKQKILPVFIDSYGGDVYALMSCIDAIKAVDKDITVATIVSGKAMSAGAVLFTCGHEGYRFMSPNSTLMFHRVSSGAVGDVDDVEISAEEARRLNDDLLRIASQNVGRPASFFSDLIKKNGNGDLHLSSTQTQKLGISNYIGIPKFEVSLQYHTDFSLDGKSLTHQVVKKKVVTNDVVPNVRTKKPAKNDAIDIDTDITTGVTDLPKPTKTKKKTSSVKKLIAKG